MDYIYLLRPKHWAKNLLIFLPLIFAFKFDVGSFWRDILAFISFGLLASGVYIINDIFDAERDRLHPTKKDRPLASGKIKVWQALLLFTVLLALSITISIMLSSAIFWISIIYLITNILYSFGLKHLAIIDVMIVALGFVFRVMAGAYAINVPVSHWILLCTFFLSLFMAFGKRKNEMDILDSASRSHRRSISEYTDSFIDQMIALTAGISIVFYSLYTIDQTTIARFGSDNLIYTTPIVVFAVLRYFHLLYNKKDGGDPVAIFTGDIQIISSVLIWLASVVFIYIQK